MAESKRRDDRQEAREAAAEQEQTNDKEDVIGADGDVMDAGRGEGLEHRQQALPRAGVEVHARAAAVQDLLPHEAVAFVDVDERLMFGIVRKEVRRDCQLARCLARRGAPQHLDGITIGKRLDGGERPRDGPAVLDERQARLEQRRNRRRPLLDERRVGELGRRLDFQLVRHIEVVKHEPAGEAVGGYVNVEIAEGGRMRQQPGG